MDEILKPCAGDWTIGLGCSVHECENHTLTCTAGLNQHPIQSPCCCQVVFSLDVNARLLPVLCVIRRPWAGASTGAWQTARVAPQECWACGHRAPSPSWTTMTLVRFYIDALHRHWHTHHGTQAEHSVQACMPSYHGPLCPIHRRLFRRTIHASLQVVTAHMLCGSASCDDAVMMAVAENLSNVPAMIRPGTG